MGDLFSGLKGTAGILDIIGMHSEHWLEMHDMVRKGNIKIKYVKRIEDVEDIYNISSLESKKIDSWFRIDNTMMRFCLKHSNFDIFQHSIYNYIGLGIHNLSGDEYLKLENFLLSSSK